MILSLCHPEVGLDLRLVAHSLIVSLIILLHHKVLGHDEMSVFARAASVETTFLQLPRLEDVLPLMVQ